MAKKKWNNRKKFSKQNQYGYAIIIKYWRQHISKLPALICFVKGWHLHHLVKEKYKGNRGCGGPAGKEEYNRRRWWRQKNRWWRRSRAGGRWWAAERKRVIKEAASRQNTGRKLGARTPAPNHPGQYGGYYQNPAPKSNSRSKLPIDRRAQSVKDKGKGMANNHIHDAFKEVGVKFPTYHQLLINVGFTYIITINLQKPKIMINK